MGNVHLNTNLNEYQKIMSFDGKSDVIDQILLHLEKSKSNLSITEKIGMSKNNFSSFPSQIFKFINLKEYG